MASKAAPSAAELGGAMQIRKKKAPTVAFVVTVSAAASMAACKKELPTVNPPPRTPPLIATSATGAQPSASATTAPSTLTIATDPSAKSPKTTEKPALPQPKPGLLVTQTKDGLCWQTPPVPEVKCPPPEEGTCNPPAPPTPQQVRCLPSFEEVRAKSKNVKLGRRADGTCYASYFCSGRCNPPGPRRVMCPPKTD